ncbi:MAG: GHKL domain-containing protein [Eubacterium sp.]|nr:GHKL domain-containing protein [Eubacterium sp.]
MLLHIYGIIYTMLFVVLCKMFIETFAKKNISNDVYGFLLLIGMVIVEYMHSVLFARFMLVKVAGIILWGTFFMWIYFKQRIIRLSILILLYYGLCITTDYISMTMVEHFIVHIQKEQLLSQTMSLLMGCLSQIVLFCIILGIRWYFTNSSASMMTEFEWVRFAIFPIFTIGSILAMLANFNVMADDRQKNVLLCMTFGMLLINVLTFYLVHDILEREAQIREDKLFRERMKNETRMYRQISENYDKQCKREHEYKNQMMVVSALVKKRELKNLDRYLDKTCEEIEHKIDSIDTNHVIVNAILNTKYQEAREKGIVFVLRINDLSDIPISDEDIVVILSNLLNNALEACEKCDEKMIKTKFTMENGQIVISVANTYVDNPIIVNGSYQTSKEDVSIHGMGIRNVKEVVDKYGGTCVIKHDNQIFRFIVFI